MKTKYTKLPYHELRAKCLSGELKHEYTTEEDYGLLLDHECQRATPNSFVLDFCADGFSQLGNYEEYKHMFERAKTAIKKSENAETNYSVLPKEDYSQLLKLPHEELRQKVFGGELNPQYMDESVFERLFCKEVEFEYPNSVIINFCIAGLK